MWRRYVYAANVHPSTISNNNLAREAQFWHISLAVHCTANYLSANFSLRFMEDVRHKATIFFFFFKLANPP